MNRKSIRWRLPASYAVIALVAALSLGSVMLLVLRGYYADQEREYLYGNATALKPMIEQILQSDQSEVPLQDQVRGLAFLSQTQIRLLDRNGNIIADSGVPDANQVVAVSGGAPLAGNVMVSVPANPPDEKGPVFVYSSDQGPALPQVVPFEKQILPGKAGDIILSVNASPYGYGFVVRGERIPMQRSSQSVEVLLMTSDGRKLGVLQFLNGPGYGADVMHSVTNAWLFASVFAIVIAAIAGWYMSKTVTQPVLVLEDATRQMERGNLAVRVDLPNEHQQEFVSLANSFNGMAEQVEQTVSTLRAFVADAAHELHTPLTALQANLELARDEKKASDRTKYLSRAQEQGQRLEALVKSLLDLSRIEAADADAKSDFAPVDLIQLVREVGEQFASRAEQTDRSFALDVPNEAVRVLGNETQLRQVLNNLLENALKFTPASGSISLQLTLESASLLTNLREHTLTGTRAPALQNHDVIKLTVSDAGIGIPPEDLAHLFERFHRGRNVSEFTGNGLGLAIVKAIVEAHAGRVEAQSAGVGEGSRFVVSLPSGGLI